MKPDKVTLAATLSLLLAFIAMPSIAEPLTDRHIEGLIRDDFDSRRGCFLERGRKCNFGMGAPTSHYGLVSDGQCPGSGRAPLTLTLPATGGYSDLGNTAYYCEGMGAYWVLRTHGALSGTATSLSGPFPIRKAGPYPEPETTRKSPPGPGPGKPLLVNAPEMRLKPGGLMRAPTALNPGTVIKTEKPTTLEPGTVIKTRPALRPGSLKKSSSGPRLGDPVPIEPQGKRPTLRISNVIEN